MSDENTTMIRLTCIITSTYSVTGIKRNTLSKPLVDHIGLAHIFYLHLLKTFRFIPVTPYNAQLSVF